MPPSARPIRASSIAASMNASMGWDVRFAQSDGSGRRKLGRLRRRAEYKICRHETSPSQGAKTL
jgi:hypothetical protein